MPRIHPLTAAAVLAAAMLWPAGGRAEPTCSVPGNAEPTEFGQQRSIDVSVSADATEARYSAIDAANNFNPDYYRFRLVITGGLGSRDWTLTIRDQDERVQQVITAADLGANDGAWSRYIKAHRVVFDLYPGTGEGVKLKVAEAIVLPEGAPPIRYSWKGQKPDYQPLYQFSAGGSDTIRRVKRSGDRVAFFLGTDQIEQQGRSKSVTWCCSGVLLAPDLLLTNWHCGGLRQSSPAAMWRDSAEFGRTCDNVLINMGWDDGSVSREANCRAVEAKDRDLDYALLRVAPVVGSSQNIGTGRPLAVATERAPLGTNLRMVHHAECKPKQVSFNCQVTEAARAGWQAAPGRGAATEFAHNCDTESGSSGAPLFNERGELVGLHHLGHETVGGGGAARCDGKNKAIHIDSILADIKAKAPLAHATIRAATAGIKP